MSNKKHPQKDLTDLRLLQAYKNLLDNILEIDPSHIFLKNQNNQFVLLNEAAAKLYNSTTEEMIEKNLLFRYVTKEEAKKLSETDKEIIKNNQTVKVNESFTIHDGTIRHFKSTKKAVIFDGEPHILGISEDITDEIEYKEKLNSAIFAEKQFIASMSHEIRTPLNSIIGYLDLLKDAELSGTNREFLHNANISAKHLFMLINDILDISKIEAGQLEIISSDFDLDEIILESGVIVSSRVNQNTTLNTIPANLPFFLNGDATRIKQIFVNLLGNAAKFTQKGHISLKLNDYKTNKNGEIELEFLVEDTGIGISKEKIEEIFKPFKRVHNKQFEGTGLGLYLSLAIAKKMGGDISVNSIPNVGTIFKIELVLKKGKDKSEIKDLEEYSALIIGDDAALSLLASEAKRSGATIGHISPKKFGAILNVEVEAKLSRIKPNLVIVATDEIESKADMLLPLIREVSPKTLIVATEGYKKADLVDRVITKPIFLSTLKELLLSKNESKNLDFSHKKILLVEDMELNAELAKELFLRNFGSELQVAYSGEEAVFRVKNEQFDLILMDIQMPGISGIEATQQIRELDSEVPIIALSANAFAEDIEKAKKAGMNDYLTKPIDKEAVKKVLEKHLSMRLKKREFDASKIASKVYELYKNEYSEKSARRLSEIAAESLISEIAALENIIINGDKQTQKFALHKLKGLLLNSGYKKVAKKVADEEEKVIRGEDIKAGLYDEIILDLEI